MAQYMVERHLPGITEEQLTAAAAAARNVTGEMSRSGTPCPASSARRSFLAKQMLLLVRRGCGGGEGRKRPRRASLRPEDPVEVKLLASEDLP